MKFVDQVRIRVQAGRGGNGAVAWRREKYVPRGGPAGGDGGRGGDIIFVADGGLSTLLDLRYRQHLRAEDGQGGGTRDKYGRAGETLVVRVPIGTVVTVEGPGTQNAPRLEDDSHDHDDDEWDDDAITNIYVEGSIPHRDGGLDPELSTDRGKEKMAPIPPAGTVLGDLTRDGAQVVIARGGSGGRGNIHFTSSTQRAPDFAEPGEPGQAMWLRLELKLLADVGIVGFPNVGKSTFIARTSRARPKIADYPFTTLVPQLGVVAVGEGRSMVVADVPGLIEGASEGRGLGHQFLRHLERTRVLLHLLAPDYTEGREPLRDLDVLEAELQNYGTMFEGRPRVVALNKADLLDTPEGRQQVAELRSALQEREIPLFVISAHTGRGVEPLLEALWRRLQMVREREAATRG